MQACNHYHQGILGFVGSQIKKVPGNQVTHTLRERGKGEKWKRFYFGGLLTRFLRGHQIEEEVMDYRPRYDQKGIDVTKTKDPKGIHGLVLSIGEFHAQIDNMLRMNGGTVEQLQQLNMDYPLSEDSRVLYRVGPRF
ncbi:hypothetical protein HAX54_049532 [Datura stramonium]|uniref:Uncharacterized protein n=1 Tax=Datura stramonium TaxID=4076 RepID=A0ABS8WPE2_DATST|nr:hypothetical protein [Datura stramonium]